MAEKTNTLSAWWCWDRDNCVEDEGDHFHEFSAGEAAEAYAEDASHEEPFDELFVCVEGGDGAVSVFRVVCEMVPSFSAESLGQQPKE